jgi:Family of unknown function (DUF6869)
MGDETERISQAWLTYQRNWWAWEGLQQAIESRPNEAWQIILRLVEEADSDDLIGAIGAGPLEDFVGKHGPSFLSQIREEAARNGKLRAALKHGWLTPSENSVVKDLVELGCEVVPIVPNTDA